MNPTQTVTGANDNPDTSLSGLNSLTLEELSEVLDRRTKETQRLQEEVEGATKFALEKLACTYEVKPDTDGQILPNYGHHIDDGLSAYSRVVLSHQRPTMQPRDYGLDQRDVSTPEKQTQHEAFSFDKAVMDLQTKLQKVQMEKDSLSQLRVMDSRRHVYQMEKMLHMLEDLQNIKRSGDQKLRETESETLALNMKVETLEKNIKGLYHTLLDYKRLCECSPVTSLKTAIPGHPSPAPMVTDNINDDIDKLQQRFLSSVEYMESKEYTEESDPKERMQQLIASLGQEVAMLTDKLSSSKDCGIGLSVKLDLLRIHAERQESFHQHQVGHLDQQLLQTQSKLAAALEEKERLSQKVEELQSQLHQAERCRNRLQCELREEVKTLRGQLQVAGEELCKGSEEKTHLLALLEQKALVTRKSQEEQLQRVQQEAEQLLARFEEARSQCQRLLAERESLKLKLDDREKAVASLGLQVESGARKATQQSRAFDSLQQENSLLSNQLNQHKQEIQQLRAELDQRQSALAAVEHEKRRLHTSVMEQTRRAHEETLEKQQLATRLEAQRVQLVDLEEKHKELEQLHSCQNKEHEGAALRLQSQLKSAQAELGRVTSALRTLEGSDGHGLQVAMGMQKEITARREQADSLQGRIQHLEETLEKLQRERGYQNLENQRHVQELAFVREEKKQLANELEALRSKDKQLRGRIGELEAILHKMSESFADCQDFLQLQEQKFFRLKLKHALDLKELQGQKVCGAPTITPPALHSPTLCALTDPPSSQRPSDARIKPIRQQESPTREIRCLVKELRGVISEKQGPHTDNRRRSAPERPLSAEETQVVTPDSKLRRRTCGSEPHFLRTPEPSAKVMSSTPICKSHVISSPLTPSRPTFPPPRLSPGRRSPVHSLLTSDPNS